MAQEAQANADKFMIPGSLTIEPFEPNITTWRRWLQRLQGAFVIFFN